MTFTALDAAWRPAGAPVVASLGPLPDDVDVHQLALALGEACPALLESGGSSRERWHVLPLVPRGSVSSRKAQTFIEWQGLDGPVTVDGPRGLDVLRVVTRGLATAPPSQDVPFAGGLVVLLAYDLAHELERLPCTTNDRDVMPWLFAVACPAALAVDVATREVLLAHVPDAAAASAGLPWGLTPPEADDVTARVRAAIDRGRATPEPEGRPVGDVVALTSREDYEDGVRRVIDYLNAGDIYQANLSQRFEVAWQGSALPLHGVLRRTNPSPLSGWLRGPSWEVVSGSPERLVKLRGRDLVTEPIKGTAPLPRGAASDAKEVAEAEDWLRASAKDHAEHVMIVDIHRNDLGRVSAPGTVRVEAMMRMDRRSHVVQAVADIRGTLRDGADAVDVIEAMFPAGSITGVPKIRCMEILDELEAFGRGPYTGSLGLVASWGDLDLNVLIRSAWRVGGRLAFAAGGGLVLDSIPEREYAETMAKARALHDAVAALRR